MSLIEKAFHFGKSSKNLNMDLILVDLQTCNPLESAVIVSQSDAPIESHVDAL